MKQRAVRVAAFAAILTAGPLAAIPAPVQGTATIKEYSLALGAQPLGITLGPDGNIWFAESNANKVGRLQPDGTLVEFPLADAGGFASLVFSGPAGDVYVNQPGIAKWSQVHALGNLAVKATSWSTIQGFAVTNGKVYATDGENIVLEALLPLGMGGGLSATLVDGHAHSFKFASSDAYGYVWLADEADNALQKFSPTGSFFQPFALPNPGSVPTSIAQGRDDRVWFTESGGDRIGRIDRYTNAITEFALTPGSAPRTIAAAPDGSLWFTEHGTNKIARITQAGAITEYTVPTPGSGPWGIAIGPDGSVWFTEEVGAKIGHLMVHPPGDVNGDGLVNVNDVFYTINYLFAGGPTPQ